MLIYNFKHVFSARGIEKPTAFLVKHGFPRGIASRIGTNKVDIIQLKYLEKVCLLLNCTPNDLLEWKTTDKKVNRPDTALYALKTDPKTKSEADLLRGLPLHELKELAKVIRER